jgi:hypothetical protein
VEAEIQICHGDLVSEFASLWEWLRGERALAGAIRAVPRPPTEDELGGVLDVLAVTLGSGGAGVTLARVADRLAAEPPTRLEDHGDLAVGQCHTGGPPGQGQ